MSALKPVPSALRDHIRDGVQILFVGINPGIRSAQLGHHFAGYSNRFWKLLYDARLVSEPLTYAEDWRLPEWRLGMTNIISRASAGIDVLTPVEYCRGMAQLERKVTRYQPQLVALLGVTIFRFLFPHQEARVLGLTSVQMAGARVFLLPNPSGRNAHYSYARMLNSFKSLRLAASHAVPSAQNRLGQRSRRVVITAQETTDSRNR